MIDFSQLISTLSRVTGIDPAAAIATGGCTVLFDGKLEVTLERTADQRSVYTFAPVLTLPPSGSARENVMQALLQVHLFGLTTNGAYFGVGPEAREAILFKTLELNHLDEDHAFAAIETFVNDLERWQTALLNMVAQKNHLSASSVNSVIPGAGAPMQLA